MAVGLAFYTILIDPELKVSTAPSAEKMSVGISLTAATTLSYWIYDLILILN